MTTTWTESPASARRGPGPPKALLYYLNVQRLSDARLIAILESAARDADIAMRSLERSERIGAAVRRSQVRMAQAEINRSLSAAWKRVGDNVRATRSLAAAAAVNANLDPMIPMLREAGLSAVRTDTMMRSQRATAVRNVEHAISRETLSKIPLSERVYKSNVLVSGQLDRMVTSALSRGLSARELAAEVRGFIHPNTPGGVRYAAMRLGRTELNNAFHATQISQARGNPFITAMRWELSGSHDRTSATSTPRVATSGMGCGRSKRCHPSRTPTAFAPAPPRSPAVLSSWTTSLLGHTTSSWMGN